MQNSLSALENKKLTDLQSIKGGRRSIGASIVYSNFLNAQGQQDIDAYDENGNWSFRYYDNSTDCNEGAMNPNW